MFGIISGIKSYLIGGALIVAVAGGAWFYYQNSQNTIKRLEAEKAIAVEANDTLRETVSQMEERRERQQQIELELRESLEDATLAQNELRRILMDHDLTNLSLEKPGLIEKRINDATKDVFDNIERITTR